MNDAEDEATAYDLTWQVLDAWERMGYEPDEGAVRYVRVVSESVVGLFGAIERGEWPGQA